MNKRTDKKARKRDRRILSAQISGAICAALCLLILTFCAWDSERYFREDSVPVSLSFTPPKEAEEEGFWDIFSEAVIRLFRIEE